MLNGIVECPNLHTYYNGKTAIDGIRELMAQHEELPELIFLDINMPVMDGWQFLDEFFGLPIPKHTVINIVTSSIDPSDMQKWENYRKRTHHTVNFLNKPIKASEIQKIMEAA